MRAARRFAAGRCAAAASAGPRCWSPWRASGSGPPPRSPRAATSASADSVATTTITAGDADSTASVTCDHGDHARRCGDEPGPRHAQRHDRVGGRHGARVELRHAARRRPRARWRPSSARCAAPTSRSPTSRRRSRSCRTPSAAARRTATRSRRRRRWRVCMTAAGFDVVNVANNHADDFGPAGQRSTEPRAARPQGCAGPAARSRSRSCAATGVRIALLGFAPYRWAPRLEQIRVAQALVRQRGLPGRPGRRRHARGRRRLGRDARAARHRVLPGREPRRLARFAHAVIDAGADLVVGSGPHVIRGIERYHGRLIAYSTGNFAGYKNFGTGGTLSLSAILRVDAARRRRASRAARGSRCAGRQRAAAPRSSNASARLVAQLSRDDFGSSAARVAANGTIRP